MGKVTGHRWRFFRAGGVDQVRIDTGQDVVHLDELDQKLWVALSCPVKGLHFDERTLELLDVDRDGRVRAPELLTAVRWLRSVLRDPEVLSRGEDGVLLSNLDEGTPEGKRVLAAARHVLKSLGKETETRITVEDATKTTEVFAKARVNGDGVVPPDAIQDPQAASVAAEIVTRLGGVTDRSGKPGYDRAHAERFFGELEAFAAWWAAGERDAKTTWPLGDATAAAAAALQAVRPKIEDYFQRCALAAFDPRSQEALNRGEDVYRELAAKDLAVSAQDVAALPLERVEAGRSLALSTGVNPAWAGPVAALRAAVVEPLLGTGQATLTPAEWTALVGRFAPWQAWQAAKAGSAVESLGIARVRQILAGSSRQALAAAVEEDLALASTVEALGQVERLTRYHRDLLKLLHNFVSFADFYGRRKAVFQAGTLFLDGRSCDLCVRVNDAGKHALLAGMSKAYLVYADCTRPSGEAMTIAAALTAGDRDNLFVGRNGLFYDRAGRDWDATVTKIIDNPISIRQAFWSPYKKVLRWIEEQVAKRAAAADEASGQRLQTAAASVGEAAAKGPAAAPAKPKIDIGTVAALGVAVGGITAAMGVLLTAFFGLGLWMPLGVVGLVLLISGPSMLIAYLKLRQRNLGPILDANGWAVNTLTKINLPLGRSLTAVAELPAGAERSLTDPYAPKKPVWPRVVLLLLVLGLAGFGLWKTGLLSRWVPGIPAPSSAWPLPWEAPAQAPGATPTPGPAEGGR